MKIRSWIIASRLRTLPLSLSCILMGAGLAKIFNSIDPIIFLLTISTTIFLQILSNLANDYGDGIKGTDQYRQGPDRMLQKGLISPKEMLVGIIIVALIAFTSGLLLLYKCFNLDQFYIALIFLLIGIFSIWAAIKYTMGKNPYGYKALGDVFVFIFFGLVGVMGSFYLFTSSWHWITIPGALFTGLLSMSVLNMNNMRDYNTDKEAGKITIVIKLGLKKAAIYHVIILSLGLLSLASILVFIQNGWIYFSLAPIPLLFMNIKKVFNYKDTIELDNELKKLALSTFFTSLIFFVLLDFI